MTIATVKTEIECLEEDYYRSANALAKYKEVCGFVPGAQVRAQFRDNPPMLGVIAPYGEGWGAWDCVPVVFANVYRQPWRVSDLTVIHGERPCHE